MGRFAIRYSAVISFGFADSSTCAISLVVRPSAINCKISRWRVVNRSVADALGSTANYLKHAGWAPGVPWGFEVIVPEGFDLMKSGESIRSVVIY